ncbi:carboxypeptidase-like regulatory domain-containing protein [Flavilitoribacter nigricans]|nr:carboxypeptidase-like regulatory domain-containing protein [Flavilitoribacter nigricans]
MRALEKTLFGVLMLCFPGVVNGQEISGSVRDQNGEPIEFASVVWWNESGEQVLTFTTTDQSGQYRLMLEVPKGLLVASSLGFQPDTVLVEFDPAGTDRQIDFELQPTTFELNTVDISDSRIPYKTTGDTVTYQSEFFSDGTEQVIEDLVRKLPGVSVSDDGTIYYKGKMVDKVLLEDDELFGQKYTIGTRSLSADVIDEIEFIDHYVENQLLKEVQQSDQLAMNITIKEDRKKLLFGDGMAGAGVPEKYESRVNLFSLYKKHKGVLVGDAGNTSGSLLDLSSLFKEGFSLDAPYEYYRPADYLVHLPNYRPFELRKEEIKNGNIYQGATNLILNPGDKLKIRTYGLGFKDRWNLDQYSYNRDLNLGNQYEYEDRSFYSEKNEGLEWNVEALAQLAERSNMKYNFRVGINEIAAQAGTTVLLPEQDTIQQFLQNQAYTHLHRLNWVSKLKNKQVLVFDGAYVNNRKTQDFYFRQAPGGQAPQNDIDQKYEHIVKDADLLASLLGKSGPLKYALNLKYRLQTDRVEASPSANSLLSQDLEFREHLQNDYRQHLLALIGSFSTQLGKARIFSRLELGYRKASLEKPDEEIQLNTGFYPGLRSGLHYQLSKKTAILLNGSVASEMPEMEHLITGPIWASYRSILLGTDRITQFLSYSGVLAINHSNNAKLLEWSANILYTNNSRAFQDRYFYDGLFGIRQKQLINGGHVWSFNGDLDKYLPALSASIGLQLYGGINQTFVIDPEGLPKAVVLTNRAVTLSYTTVFDGPLDFGLSGEQSWSVYQQIRSGSSAVKPNKRTNLNYFLVYKPGSNFLLRLSTRQVFTQNQGQPAGIFYLGGLRSEYRFGSGFRLGFNVYNLWNTRGYNLQNFNGESYSFQQWRLNPRMLILSLGFRF